MSDSKNSFVDRLTSEVVLGTLVVILSVFTAYVAYQGALMDSASSGHEVEAQRVLANSNTDYLLANQTAILDYQTYDNYRVNLDVDDFAADYYRGNFSEELEKAIERPDGPFDDAYYEELFGEAEAELDRAFEIYDLAGEEGDKADAYQQVMLILAVGLSFAAWASLVAEGNRMRLVFTVLAVVAFVGGLIRYLTL